MTLMLRAESCGKIAAIVGIARAEINTKMRIFEIAPVSFGFGLAWVFVVLSGSIRVWSSRVGVCGVSVSFFM